MTFTIRQLEVFVEAAGDENFRATADRLGITQPTLSTHIASLERALGSTLFDRRRGSSARLSARGQAMLAWAKLMLHDARELAGRSGQGTTDKALRIVAGPIVIDHIVKPALREYYAAGDLPDLDLMPGVAGEDAYSQLRRGDADIGLFIGDEPRTPGLSVVLLRKIEVGAYACPALASTIGSDPSRLAGAPWILAPVGSAVDIWLRRILGEVGIVPAEIVARTQFPEISRDLALDCRGIAILFESDAQAHVASGELVQLPVRFASGYRFMLMPDRDPDPVTARAIAFWRRKMQ